MVGDLKTKMVRNDEHGRSSVCLVIVGNPSKPPWAVASKGWSSGVGRVMRELVEGLIIYLELR